MATNVFLEVNLFPFINQVYKSIHHFSELPCCFSYQEGLQLLPACAANRCCLTEMNARTVKPMQHFHEVIDVHRPCSQFVSLKTLEDFLYLCFYIEIHRHVLKFLKFLLNQYKSKSINYFSPNC
jgi:hypothetical protein